ncbi:MAG: hypothetical protein FWD89_00455 [Firmicutes bacterium]|nr:hypothetical protein [Bacillota bacterium]MCL2770770.1 hypothetical protein [Bacillota bacterium]
MEKKEEEKKVGYLIAIECIDNRFSKRVGEMLNEFFRKNKQKSSVAFLAGKTEFEEQPKQKDKNKKGGNNQQKPQAVEKPLGEFNDKLSPIAVYLDYGAKVAELIKEKINPKLDEGEIVITHNFAVGAEAFFTYGLGLDSKKVKNINKCIYSKLRPDYTIFLDIFAEHIVKDARLKEKMELTYLGYKRLLRKDRKLLIVNAENKEDVILLHIVESLTKRGIIASE